MVNTWDTIMNLSSVTSAIQSYDFDMHYTTLKECGGMDMYAMSPAIVVAAFHNGSLAVADDVIDTWHGIAKIIAQVSSAHFKHANATIMNE